ncbi:hypothetical protein RS130_19235 [Paraglaciecola aquimarina]|uniref:Uncharacterized protein n=1 Tax=Paraglaciecola aquimarina TaxID=1235557 RepID=A0ABU3T0F5_9ALTE|nr:hypothetical protein [Paraglaciecola aquimarina]MDU0355730.1 hypothetical protein [Paraglaciecola aquimarina]
MNLFVKTSASSMNTSCQTSKSDCNFDSPRQCSHLGFNIIKTKGLATKVDSPQSLASNSVVVKQSKSIATLIEYPVSFILSILSPFLPSMTAANVGTSSTAIASNMTTLCHSLLSRFTVISQGSRIVSFH